MPYIGCRVASGYKSIARAHVAHAETIDEEDKLIQAGFEFIRFDDRENIALYRKRK